MPMGMGMNPMMMNHMAMGMGPMGMGMNPMMMGPMGMMSPMGMNPMMMGMGMGPMMGPMGMGMGPMGMGMMGGRDDYDPSDESPPYEEPRKARILADIMSIK